MDFLIILLLFLLNGFFAMSEMALVSAKPARLETYRTKHRRGVRVVLKLQENAKQFLSAIQIGITLVSFITGFYGGTSIASYFVPWFEQMGLTVAFAARVASAFSILLVTFFAIVIGELVPKTIGLSNPEKIAVRVAGVIYLFSGFFYPVVKGLSFSTTLINKIIGISSEGQNITEDELKNIIKDASIKGVIEEEQNSIHENLFDFSDKRVKHVMTHRAEIEWLDQNLSKEDFEEQLLQCKKSKVLICNKVLDDYVGVLNVKEYLLQKILNHDTTLQTLMEEPIIVPETANAQDLLTELREQQFYFCVVIDEFGTVEGIVTLHDLMESIVGELPEEEEVVEPDYLSNGDHSFLVNGDAPIETLTEIIPDFEIDFEETEYATVAGFVLDHIEKIPETGDCFSFMGYQVKITDIEHHRIEKVLFTKE
ncbi:MAG: hemolysin family protein [Bacteroidales bacterium]|nr:hemolysin family protein [Bacteroidales bacterium]